MLLEIPVLVMLTKIQTSICLAHGWRYLVKVCFEYLFPKMCRELFRCPTGSLLQPFLKKWQVSRSPRLVSSNVCPVMHPGADNFTWEGWQFASQMSGSVQGVKRCHLLDEGLELHKIVWGRRGDLPLGLERSTVAFFCAWYVQKHVKRG